MNSLTWMCVEGELAGVREAIARGEDVNDKSYADNKTPLMMAVMKKHNSIVKLLLEQPTLDLNSTDSNGWTALHWAALYDNAEGVKLLLADRRLNTHNLEDYSGRTPVMRAIGVKSVNALRELVAHPSVDLDRRDYLGRSLEDCALQWARGIKGREMRRIIIEARLRRRMEAEGQQLENIQDQALAVTPRAPPASTPADHPSTTPAPSPTAPPATHPAAGARADDLAERQGTEDLQVLGEVEELRRRQEEVVQVAIRENAESEMRVLRKSEERVEGLRRENQEREEKIEKDRKEAEEKVEKEWKAKEERLRQEKEEVLAALASRSKEREEQMKREKSEGEEQLRRENKQLEEEQRRKNEENLELLVNENEAQMVKMLAKQKKKEKEEEEGRVAKKRKAVDQLDASNKQPAAPECPVCFDEMVPPTKIFHCVNGHHICETCKLGLNPLMCPKCRKKITGRASDMENFLKELLPSTSKAPQI